MKLLFIIPARGGSKGIPGKNRKRLAGKPLIHYSIEYARLFASDQDICLTTDNMEIADCAMEIGYSVPFMRPEFLSTDQSGTHEVVLHAYKHYLDKNQYYDAIVLLQPTSPFRQKKHLEEALLAFGTNVDMVVSVTESANNPYYNLFEEDNSGHLKISKGEGSYVRRQDCPSVYAFNGSLYIIKPDSLLGTHKFGDFKSVKKYVMPEKYNLDLDTQSDWERAEYMSQNFAGN